MKNLPKYAVTLFAMRGRPNERGHYTQRFERADRGIANAITSVTKDNLLLYDYTRTDTGAD